MIALIGHDGGRVRSRLCGGAPGGAVGVLAARSLPRPLRRLEGQDQRRRLDPELQPAARPRTRPTAARAAAESSLEDPVEALAAPLAEHPGQSARVLHDQGYEVGRSSASRRGSGSLGSIRLTHRPIRIGEVIADPGR